MARSRRSKWLLVIIVAAIVLMVIFGIPFINHLINTVSTDDAYVNGHVTFVAPRVTGQVVEVLVDDNDRVKNGRRAGAARQAAISGDRGSKAGGARRGPGRI